MVTFGVWINKQVIPYGIMGWLVWVMDLYLSLMNRHLFNLYISILIPNHSIQ